jgi:hypothetical protein
VIFIQNIAPLDSQSALCAQVVYFGVVTIGGSEVGLQGCNVLKVFNTRVKYGTSVQKSMSGYPYASQYVSVVREGKGNAYELAGANV